MCAPRRIALLAALALAGCSSTECARLRTIRVGSARFEVGVADEPGERHRGLMGRRELPFDGLLFVWEDVEERGFYMKDTLIPLDLIGIRGDRVVSIDTMQPCERMPCPTTYTAPADAALEVEAGTASEEQISIGDTVEELDPGCGVT